jgi:hypothetical protein
MAAIVCLCTSVRTPWRAGIELWPERQQLHVSGVDWVAVHKYVDVSKKLESFANPHQKRSQSKLRSLWARLSSWCSCWQQCCFGRRRHADDVLTSLDKETLGDVELGAPEPRCTLWPQCLFYVSSGDYVIIKSEVLGMGYFFTWCSSSKVHALHQQTPAGARHSCFVIFVPFTRDGVEGALLRCCSQCSSQGGERRRQQCSNDL